MILARSALVGTIAYPAFNGTDYDLYFGQVDGSGRGLLRGVLDKAGQHHGAVERFDVNACRVHILVVDETALDRRGDAGVIDVGADGLLVASDRATRSAEQGCCNDGGGEGGANDHGETSGGCV